MHLKQCGCFTPDTIKKSYTTPKAVDFTEPSDRQPKSDDGSIMEEDDFGFQLQSDSDSSFDASQEMDSNIGALCAR